MGRALAPANWMGVGRGGCGADIVSSAVLRVGAGEQRTSVRRRTNRV